MTKKIINIVLFVLLFLMVFVLLLCPRDWIYPNTYSDDAIDVIRIISLCEVVISVILGSLNKRRITIAVLIASNVFTIYKFISTFIIV